MTVGASEAARPVGVVFIHGIGSQPQSETVREFGRPLITWLEEWHRARAIDGFRVVSADLSYGGDVAGPARFRLEVPAYTGPLRADPANEGRTWPSCTWVLAEAWWSTRLIAPDYGRMLAWSARILLRTVWQLSREAALRLQTLVERLLGKPGPVALSDLGQFGAFIEFWGTFLLTLQYTLGAVVGYLVLAVLFPLSFIPIQAVRDFILVRLVQPFLVDNVGDFETFVEDDVQALNIRRSVERAIAHLVDVEKCASVIVVAHSQGAVVAFDALCSRGREGFPEVSKLITFGGALNKAFLLKPDSVRLRGSLPDHIFWLDVYSYYDPVPGGKLAGRAAEPFLVHPPEALRRTMHWYADEGDGPMERKAVNRMNVLTDHGQYWDNWEHFTQRVAQEIDLPTGYYHDSRFYNVDEKRRSRQRRLRITTLVGWRLAAMYLFLIAVFARRFHGGLEQFQRDGRAITDWMAQIPGMEIVAIPGQMLSPLSRWLDPSPWEPLGLVLLALLLFAAAFALAYLGLSFVLFHWWDAGERRRSVELAPLYRPRVLLRSIAVILPMTLLGYLVSWP